MFEKLLGSAKNLKDVEYGLSYLTGDQDLAKDLMESILPFELTDKSNSDQNSDPLLKINTENILMYYLDFYNKKYEEQLSVPLTYFEKVGLSL